MKSDPDQYTTTLSSDTIMHMYSLHIYNISVFPVFLYPVQITRVALDLSGNGRALRLLKSHLGNQGTNNDLVFQSYVILISTPYSG